MHVVCVAPDSLCGGTDKLVEKREEEQQQKGYKFYSKVSKDMKIHI